MVTLSPPLTANWRLRAFASLVLLCASTAQAIGLNDTGSTDCKNDVDVVTTGVASDGGTHPRQDCRYGRDAAAAAGRLPKTGAGVKGFDFQKIANDGTVLEATAALGTAAGDWACTRDNVTGLIWEVKTNAGLRGQTHIYSWYSSNAATNGGYVGTASGGYSFCATSGPCNTEQFVADVNAAGLCGAADWRLPTRKELVSIVDYGSKHLTIDLAYFPHTNSYVAPFWSASTLDSPYVPGYRAWVVDFSSGVVRGDLKSGVNQVRLVRGGQ